MLRDSGRASLLASLFPTWLGRSLGPDREKPFRVIRVLPFIYRNEKRNDIIMNNGI